MICKNCGNVVENGMEFCSRCGSRVERSSASFGGGVSEKTRKLLCGPVFTVAAVGAVVYLFLFLISLFSGGFLESTLSTYMPLLDSADLSDFISLGFLQRMKVASVLLGLIANLPLILEVIGLIMLMVYVRKGSGSTGLGLIKAGIVITIIYLSLFALIALIGGIIAAVGGSYAGDSVFVAVLITFIIIAVVFVLAYWYLGGMLSTVSSAEGALVRNIAGKRPSMYVAVINFLSTVGCVIGAIVYIAGSVFVSYAVLPAIMQIVAAVMYVLFGVTIIQGRNLDRFALQPEYYTSSAPTGSAYGEPTAAFSGTAPVSPAASAAPEETAAADSFCIYCGRPLRGGEVCTCQQAAPAAPAETAEPKGEKHFCIYCGRTLYGDEICPCQTAASAAPSVSEVPPASAVDGGLKSTMRTAEQPADAKTAQDMEDGKQFLNKAGNLDA